MLKNLHYDMVEEIAELSKSLSRMDRYIKDSKGCTDCERLWNDLKKRQQEELNMVYSEFEKHVKQGGVGA
ncbi:MAG: hypothetical protein A4E57_04386 [Syntrophorhabdaceae bacterium PtaU1.Bin034]|nr:MAG: hypothetical protein A4E57_04386 [Syntrophorhabdaceae bacterium PtaU1.Bin034]